MSLRGWCTKCEDARFLLVACGEHPEMVAQRLGLKVDSLRQHLQRANHHDLVDVINEWTPVEEGWYSNGTLGARTLDRVLDEAVRRSRGERVVRR